MDQSTPERWLPVVGYEGLYLVSDLGRVRSLPRQTARGIRSGCLLRPFPGRAGYLVVNLSRDGHGTRVFVHKLVAAAFIGECPPGQQVRHGPNGQRDNRASQLCYGTSAENHRDRRRDGTAPIGEANGRATLTEADVRSIRAAWASGIPQTQLAARYGVGTSTIHHVIHHTWKHIT